MANVFGKKLVTGPKNRVNCHFTVENRTYHALQNESERLQTSKNWLVNEVLKRALILREIEVKVPQDVAS